MLAKTRDLEERDSEAAGFLESAEPFICALARLYCRRLFEAMRFGIRQEYVAHDELLPVLRGRVHWPSQAKRLGASSRADGGATGGRHLWRYVLVWVDAIEVVDYERAGDLIQQADEIPCEAEKP